MYATEFSGGDTFGGIGRRQRGLTRSVAERLERSRSAYSRTALLRQCMGRGGGALRCRPLPPGPSPPPRVPVLRHTSGGNQRATGEGGRGVEPEPKATGKSVTKWSEEARVAVLRGADSIERQRHPAARPEAGPHRRPTSDDDGGSGFFCTQKSKPRPQHLQQTFEFENRSSGQGALASCDGSQRNTCLQIITAGRRSARASAIIWSIQPMKTKSVGPSSFSRNLSFPFQLPPML